MHRRAASAFIATLSVLSLSQIAASQKVDVPNPALRASTVDPAALGATERSFFEYSMGDSFDYNAAAGFAFAGGSLRAAYQHAYQQRGYGLGYARTLTARDFGVLGTAGAGLDVFGAYMTSPVGEGSRGAKISIPLSLRWGSPSRLSIAPYVAPYAEFGRSAYLYSTCADFNCPLQSGLFSSRTSGLAAGLHIDAWRLGLNLELRDVTYLHRQLQQGQFTLGARVHF